MKTKAIRITSIRVEARAGASELATVMEAVALSMIEGQLVVVEGFNGRTFTADPAKIASNVIAASRASSEPTE